MKVLAYPRTDGGLSVIVPAPGFSLEQVLSNPSIQEELTKHQAAGEMVRIEDGDLPQDRLFRDAWKLEGGSCVECPVKSKSIAHNLRRAKREAEFAPHDKVVSLQLPGIVEAEKARAAIRQADAALQEQIDAATSVAQLRELLK